MNSHYQIGPFRFDARTRLLTCADIAEPIGTRAAAVLAVLVEHANEPVLKSAILDAAWPGLVVEESNLTVQISKIRRVLGKAPNGSRWIETLARRGYRFVGPVKEVSPAPPEGADSDARSNLPRSLTSFIGRDTETRELSAMLRSHRLLTLVGAGGIGKTRLALQIAPELAESYRDGVWFVDLAPITDPHLVASAIAQVLRVREAGERPLAEILCRNLRQQNLLLLLDNCEHVRVASATIAEMLLKAAAGLTILATSREPLGVDGEQIYPLAPLSLPEPDADAGAIARADAVRLFVARSLQHQPGFELTPRNVAGIAELCIHLDGIPLALELAAARVSALSIGEINAHLDDRFRLLASRTSTALPRQQTMRATFDWSFDLLMAPERLVASRLAVFAGGFTLDAAASVCAAGDIEPDAMVDLLTRLVDRSLVVADTARGGTRYRLLETTRAYALDRLSEAGEGASTRRRHAQCMRDLFDSAALDWIRMPDARWRERYLPERDNVRAALDWAFGDGGDRRLGVALAGGSGALWFELSLQTEGRRWLEAAVATMDNDAVSAGEWARAWLWLAKLWGTAAPTRAVETAERSVALYRSLGDDVLLGQSLVWLARIWVFMGRFIPAAVAFAEARPLLERAAVPKPLGSCLEGYGFLQMLTGDLAGARTSFERALSLFSAAGAESSVFGVLVNLGDLTWALGDLDAALSRCREAVRLMRGTLYAKEMLGTCLTNLAGVLIERGELAEALRVAREGLPMRQDSGHGWLSMDHFALRAALVGKLETAARIAGFVGATHASKPSLRQPNEARAHAHLMRLLRDRFSENEISSLLAGGADLSADEACRLALED